MGNKATNTPQIQTHVPALSARAHTAPNTQYTSHYSEKESRWGGGELLRWNTSFHACPPLPSPHPIFLSFLSSLSLSLSLSLHHAVIHRPSSVAMIVLLARVMRRRATPFFRSCQMHLLRLQQHLEVLFSPDINCVVTDITTMILQQNKFLSSCVAVISFFLFFFF